MTNCDEISWLGDLKRREKSKRKKIHFIFIFTKTFYVLINWIELNLPHSWTIDRREMRKDEKTDRQTDRMNEVLDQQTFSLTPLTIMTLCLIRCFGQSFLDRLVKLFLFISLPSSSSTFSASLVIQSAFMK